jgi:3-oxoacyl-[acyl-carrier protein] reductase
MGRVVVVTGATGTLGSDLSSRLARAGLTVAFTYLRDAAGARRLEEDLRRQDGRSRGWRVDVTDPDQVRGFAAELRDRFGSVQGLVNSAGVSNSSDPVTDTPEEVWNAIIALNLTGTFLMCKYVAPLILSGGAGGRIVNVSSIFGHNTPALRAAYGASKHGVIGLTQALAKELGPSGVTVNAVCPGGVHSPMQDRMWLKSARERGQSLEEFRALKLAAVPVGRVCEPYEVSAAIELLLGPEGGFINGACVDITGGAV